MTVVTLFEDDRGASAVISYILSLAILLLVVSTVGIAGTQHMDRITDAQTEGQLDSVAQQVGYEVQYVDRLVRSDGVSDSSGISRSVSLPNAVASQQYTISISQAPAYDESDDFKDFIIEIQAGGGATTQIPLETQSEVAETSVRGGHIEVIRPQPTNENYNGGDGICEPVDDTGSFTSVEDNPDNHDVCKITLIEGE